LALYFASGKLWTCEVYNVFISIVQDNIIGILQGEKYIFVVLLALICGITK